jgi:cytidine deaminase
MTDLLAAARAARANAYAPYSVYRVGAAVLGSDGQVYSGCNVENVSFGLTVCAERTAVVKMVSEGCREVQRVGGTPCGMCLQTLAEFAADPAQVPVVLEAEDGTQSRYTLAELLPHGFKSELKTP